MPKPKILFLFSDTGGGHRSAAEAIMEALELEFPGRFQTEMLDIFREYAPLPFNYAPDIYPRFSKLPRMWEWTYTVSDGKRRMRVFYNFLWPYLRRSLRQLLNEHPAEVIVSVHSLVNTPIMRARVNTNSRFVTVVTDLVSTHAAWYHSGADLVIVPTELAREKALKSGLPDEKIMVIGQPVAERYIQPMPDVNEIRIKNDWQLNIPTVLLVGGGEGMGNLEHFAIEINNAGLKCQLIIIAGRNEKARLMLEQVNWKIPIKIYGFVKNMPEFMHAADILITKAGPGTISEAFIASLPVILFSKMPGQESGNVDYVVNHGAGAWAPEAEIMIAKLRQWLEDPSKMQLVSKNASMLAKPMASRQIARAIAAQVKLSMDNPKKISV